MNFYELFLLGIGLSMDAFAVSITDGMTFEKVTFKRAFVIALTFGIFQAFMPVLGYLGGNFFYDKIRKIDHWIALILLGFLGGKMIIEAIAEYFSKRTARNIDKVSPGIVKEKLNEKITFKLLIIQGIATSIDALAVGISLAAVNANIVYSAAIIGVITTAVCLPAVYLGKKTGDLLSDKAELLGGCILIGIGVKIFVQHMIAG
jgi:manganese efflux pump family protein